jgi:hypothetical protein
VRGVLYSPFFHEYQVGIKRVKEAGARVATSNSQDKKVSVHSSESMDELKQHKN